MAPNSKNRGSVAFAAWLLLVCIVIASISAGFVLIRDGSVRENSSWGDFAFLARWAAFGIGMWVIALVGGAVARLFLKDGTQPEVVRRTYALCVASAIVIADVLLLMFRQASLTAAVWGIAVAVVVASAAYLLFPAGAVASRGPSL